ncbi:MAG: hypothetical protein M3N19_01015 [Candidatus Eremiobacteraeota bacterium]|nr:hypothetical protein [Candidatus Eremiobacteraeota bacterium]
MDRTPGQYLYVLDKQFKVMLGPGVGPGPLAAFFTEDSSIDELPQAVLAVVRHLNAKLALPASATFEGLSIQVVRMDGESGPHIGVLIAENRV